MSEILDMAAAAWNIILYFSIALDCDTPILESLIQCKPELISTQMINSLHNQARCHALLREFSCFIHLSPVEHGREFRIDWVGFRRSIVTVKVSKKRYLKLEVPTNYNTPYIGRMRLVKKTTRGIIDKNVRDRFTAISHELASLIEREVKCTIML